MTTSPHPDSVGNPETGRLTVTGFFSLRFKEEQIGFPVRTFPRINPTINITDVVPGPYEPTSHKLATRAIFTKKGTRRQSGIPLFIEMVPKAVFAR
jgi:hypothetical protein